MNRTFVIKLNHAQCGTCGTACPVAPQSLSAGARATFESGMSRQRRLAADVEVFRQGEVAREFYIIVDGWICLYKLLPDGRRQNIKFALPGDLVGFAVDSGEEIDYFAITITPVTLDVVRAQDVAERFVREPQLMRRIARYMLREQMSARDQLISIARMSALERVAYLLYDTVKRALKRPPRAGDQMALPLTQEMIGDAVGLTAVHVNRMVSRLRREGVLSLHGGHLTLHRPEQLAKLASVYTDAPGSPSDMTSGHGRLSGRDVLKA